MSRPLPLTLLALFTALAMLALAALHVYWICGGAWGLVAATPLVDGAPVLEVTARPPYIALILLLAMGGYVMLCQAGVFAKALLPGFYRWGSWIAALFFLSRALGDTHGVGFLKTVTDTRFAWYDTWIVSPLCLVLAVACAAVAVLDARMDKRTDTHGDKGAGKHADTTEPQGDGHGHV